MENVFIMDTFCADRGSLLDNSQLESLSSTGPKSHSVHCLVDIAPCRLGGYEVLEEPPAGQEYHCRRFALDTVGNDKVLALARSTGLVEAKPKCKTCTGTGTLDKGLRVTVVGTASAADISRVPDSLTPGILNVEEVYDASQTCANLSIATVPPGCTGLQGPLTDRQLRTIAHGSMMLLGWGILLPTGVMIAKTMRHRNPLWYKMHSVIQTVGLLLTIAGFIVALSSFDVFIAGGGGHFLSVLHGGIGIVVMIVAILQPLNAVLRPHVPEEGEEKSAKRKNWERLHKGAGYGAVALGLINIILGAMLTMWRNQFLITWAVVVVSIIGAGAYLHNEGKRKKMRTPRGSEEEMNAIE